MLVPEEFDIDVRSHRLHAQRFGDPVAPLVIALPGLSGNMKSFDFLGERIAGDRLQLVAVDLRGRGKSEATGPGTYGSENHALDVLALADELGFGRFAVIGQSMGGRVAMKAAEMDGPRLDAVVLLDALGVPDPGTLAVVASSVSRLDTVYPSTDVYIENVKSQGLIEPWSDYWERYYRYELEDVEGGGVRSRTRADAIAEDAAYGAGQDLYASWAALTMPTLVVRAAREFKTGAGYIVTTADRDRFLHEVPTGSVVEVDGNHLTVNTHPATATAIEEFLGKARGG